MALRKATDLFRSTSGHFRSLLVTSGYLRLFFGHFLLLPINFCFLFGQLAVNFGHIPVTSFQLPITSCKLPVNYLSLPVNVWPFLVNFLSHPVYFRSTSDLLPIISGQLLMTSDPFRSRSLLIRSSKCSKFKEYPPSLPPQFLATSATVCCIMM